MTPNIVNVTYILKLRIFVRSKSLPFLRCPYQSDRDFSFFFDIGMLWLSSLFQAMFECGNELLWSNSILPIKSVVLCSTDHLQTTGHQIPALLWPGVI